MTSQDKVVKLSDIVIPKFQPLVNDREHMHQVISSGRAGTKSSFMGIISDFLLVSEPNSAAIIMRKHHNKLRKTVYKECIRAIGRLGLSKKQFTITKSPMQITYKGNGNTLYFTGSDSIDDTKGMIDEERQIRLVVLDELTEFFDKGEGAEELANIEATFVRGNDDFFRMMYLFNPPKNEQAPIMKWLRSMKKRSDTIHVHVTYKDVPVAWLGKKLIQSAEAMLQVDPEMYKWVWLGMCTGLAEVVYYMFKKEHEIEKASYKDLIHIGIGVDYGQLNATTYQAFLLNQSKMRIEGLPEYYHSGRESGHQKPPSEYAKDFKEYYEEIERLTGKRIEAVFIDPSARGLAEEIKRILPRVKIKPAENSVKLGIERTQKFFSFMKLFICNEQVHLKEELGLYKYNKDLLDKGKEEVVKTNDHCCDAMRYYIMGMWRYLRLLLPATERGDK